LCGAGTGVNCVSSFRSRICIKTHSLDAPLVVINHLGEVPAEIGSSETASDHFSAPVRFLQRVRQVGMAKTISGPSDIVLNITAIVGDM
jgi:hypothetical protein